MAGNRSPGERAEKTGLDRTQRNGRREELIVRESRKAAFVDKADHDRVAIVESRTQQAPQTDRETSVRHLGKPAFSLGQAQ